MLRSSELVKWVSLPKIKSTSPSLSRQKWKNYENLLRGLKFWETKSMKNRDLYFSGKKNMHNDPKALHFNLCRESNERILDEFKFFQWRKAIEGLIHVNERGKKLQFSRYEIRRDLEGYVHITLKHIISSVLVNHLLFYNIF